MRKAWYAAYSPSGKAPTPWKFREVFTAPAQCAVTTSLRTYLGTVYTLSHEHEEHAVFQVIVRRRTCERKSGGAHAEDKQSRSLAPDEAAPERARSGAGCLTSRPSVRCAEESLTQTWRLSCENITRFCGPGAVTGIGQRRDHIMSEKINQKGKVVTAVLYIRVSTKKQVEKGYSLEDQQRELPKYCARQSWQVAETFIDGGKTGRTADRSGFRRLLAFCKKERVDFVVVAALNRFARDMQVQADAIAALGRCGTRVRSLAEPNVDDTAAGKLAANMIGAFNQYFSDALSERMQQAGRSARQSGRYPRSAPLGYKNVKPFPGEANIVPDEAAVPIARGFELMATGNYTKAEILRILTSEGFTTKGGKPVPMQTFVEMLKNPLYIGLQRSRKYDEVTQGLWRRIVDDETFYAVQMITAGKKPTTTPHARSRPDFPLRITLLCEGCGKPLTGGKPKGRNGKQFSYYWCRTKGCRTVKSIKTSVIDAQFVKLLQRLKGNPDFVAKFLPLYEKALRAREEDSKAETRALEAKIEKVEQQRKTLDKERYLDKTMPDDIYREMRADVCEEIDGLEERLAYVSMPQTIRELRWLVHRDSLLDVSKGWERGTVAQRQTFQKLLFPGGLTVTSTGKLFEPDKDTLFSHLESLTTDFINLASPAGFEPALPP